MTPVSVADAAAANAHWCDLLCRTHGVTGVFAADAWTAAKRTPPFYPDAVTLAPGVSATELLARVDNSPGCSIKDSFGDLDLAGAGFSVLFEAQWVAREASTLGSRIAAAGAVWSTVTDPEDLRRWEVAWSRGEPPGLFRPALLDNPGVEVFAARHGTSIVAGGIINGVGPVFGLSNVFGPAQDPDLSWAGLTAAVTARRGAHALVGYERGEELGAALRHGFAPLGRLRVWTR